MTGRRERPRDPGGDERLNDGYTDVHLDRRRFMDGLAAAAASVPPLIAANRPRVSR